MAITVTVPPSTTKLISLADLKAILGIADSANDTLLGNIIQRGSDAIARFCNRVFAQRTVIETLPGPGGQLLKLKFSPIVTLTSIALDGEAVDPDTYVLTEPEAGIIFRESYWAYTGHKYSYTAAGRAGAVQGHMARAPARPFRERWNPCRTSIRCSMVPRMAERRGRFRRTCRNCFCRIRSSSFDGRSGSGIDWRGRGNDHLQAGRAWQL